MKVKNLVLMALVATMGLVSCSKDEHEDGVKTDTMPKSVTIKLPNIQKTVKSRATGDAMKGGSQVALENFKVFFVDAAGNLQTVPQYENQDQQVYFSKTDSEWAEIGENGKDITYHFLPAATSKVVVVGNIGDVEYSTIATRVDHIPNDNGSGHPTYPLYGEDELEEKKLDGSEIHDNVYTANVTLEPRVSRFEIYGFQYTQEGDVPKYTSVKLQKIALNNYYTQSDFVSKLPVEDTKVFETIDHTEVWGWIEDRSAPWADELNLELAVGGKKFVDGIPEDSDLVFDVRFLPNPYYVEELRPKTGNDVEIQQYVMKYDEAKIFLNKLEDMVTFLIPHYISEGKNRLIEDTKAKMSLDDLFSQIQSGNVKELDIIVKADVQGSVEAVKQSLVKLSNEEVVVKVIHGGVGAINESDVSLASASNAIIIGFNVRPDPTAKLTADKENVDIRLYKVIYNAIEDVEAAMKGMLDPVYEEKVLGHAEIRQIFKASGVGNIAGSYVLDGMFQRGCKVRISREGEQIFEGDLASLKRFKDDVKEVKAGFECGLVFEGFGDFQELDIVEAYTMVEVPR